MMKSTNACLVALTVMLGLCFLAPEGAADHGMYKGTYHHGGWKGKGLDGKVFYKAHFLLEHADEIGLSEKQVEAIRGLKMNAKKNVIRHDADIEILKLDIHSKLREDKVNVSQIEGLIDQKYEVKKARAKALVDAYAALKAAVTEDQWAKVKELKKSMWGNQQG